MNKIIETLGRFSPSTAGRIPYIEVIEAIVAIAEGLGRMVLQEIPEANEISVETR